MSSSWYLSGPDATRFNWNKEPTFQCPNADAVTYTAADDGGEGTWTLQRPEIATAAAAIDADPVMLGRLLRQRHASFTAGRLRIDGRLTDRCAICGAKMTRKGFRAWIDQASDDDASQRVARRLGLDGPRTTVRTTWHPTKTEAQAWARHELKRARARAATSP
jgi:hypothetical protein